MSAVEVEISGTDGSAAEAPPPEVDGPDARGPNGPDPDRSAPPPRDEDRSYRRRAAGPEVEVEREVTKRQLIESITTILVVVLYMVFTLVRERESGVIVIDPDGRDDWDE